MKFRLEEVSYSPKMFDKVTEDGKYRITAFNGMAQVKEVIEVSTGKKIGKWIYPTEEDAIKFIESLYA